MKNGMKSFAVIVGLSALLAASSALALEPHLEKAIQQGKQNFTHNTFGGNGRVCQSCHLDGGLKPGKLPNGKPIPSLGNAATLFPHFRKQDNKVITLSGQIRACIAGGLQGKPPAYGSEELNSLVSYVTSLSQGKAINMGGKLQ
jgi:thiosulfate dehydrogenase